MTGRTPNPRDRKRAREAGFTLVEMLVALFVFSALSAATLGVLTNTLRAQRGVEVALERVEALAVLDAILRQDMANLSTRPTRDSLGQTEIVSLQSYAPDGALLLFTREGRSNPGGLLARGETERVGYYLEGDQLVRRSSSSPTPAQGTPERERVLLSGVAGADVGARLGGQSVLQLSVPAGSPNLPDVVTLDLALEDGGDLVFVLGTGA